MSIQPGTPPQTPAKAQVAFGYPLMAIRQRQSKPIPSMQLHDIKTGWNLHSKGIQMCL